MKNKKDVIIIILLGVVIIMLFNIGSKIKNLNNNYNNLSNQINWMQNDINSTNNNINSLVDNKKLIQKYDYIITNIDDEYKNAKVSVDLTFSSIAKGSKVYYVYRNITGGDKIEDYKEDNITYGDWVKVELREVESGNFLGDIEMSYDYNYETKVIVETNEEIISEDLYRLDLYEQSKPNYSLDINPNSYSSEGSFTYSINLNIQKMINKVEVKSAYCEIYYNGKIIDEFEIMTDKNKKQAESDFVWYNIDGKEKVDPSKNSNNPNIKIVIKVKDNFQREFTHEWNDMF